MLIDFEKIEEEVLQNFKGGEQNYIARMFVDENNRIMYGKLEPGSSIGLHTHDAGSEIMYFLHGTGKAIYDGKEERVEAGMCHYCPKGHSHCLINDSDCNLVFFAVVPQQ